MRRRKNKTHRKYYINPLCAGEHHHRRRAYCYNRIKCTARSAFCVRRQRQRRRRRRRRYNIRNPFVCIPAVSPTRTRVYTYRYLRSSLSLRPAYPVVPRLSSTRLAPSQRRLLLHRYIYYMFLFRYRFGLVQSRRFFSVVLSAPRSIARVRVYSAGSYTSYLLPPPL
uniref:Uncharacterized protein n=1 Tax=Schizaphis graminum TaxID=13262 RepID=A0A2S2NUN4_SCHGA